MYLAEYFQLLKEQYDTLSFSCPTSTPYHDLGIEIAEMISSYLDDSLYFSSHNDIVNQYASLVYAHGWFDAGLYLGIITTSEIKIYFQIIEFPEKYNEQHLDQKNTKYYSMLSAALKSISSYPVKGSPLKKACEHCISIAREALIKADELNEKKTIIPALGYLCYGYGWLDTAVRTGLASVHVKPDLFTTEI